MLFAQEHIPAHHTAAGHHDALLCSPEVGAPECVLIPLQLERHRADQGRFVLYEAAGIICKNTRGAK